MSVVGKRPPSDLDAEGALLGALMVRGAVAVDELESLLCAADFYSGAHGFVFEAISKARAAAKPIDMVTVGAELKDARKLEQIGGMPFLLELMDSAPAVNAEAILAYAKRVRLLARLRSALLICQQAEAELYNGVPEPKEFLEKLERDVQSVASDGQATDVRKLGEAIKTSFGKLQEHYSRGGGVLGIPTGFLDLDRLMGGMHAGDLTIVAARPGIGKTSFVLSLCEQVSAKDVGCLIFSLEMPTEQLATRMVCSKGNVNLAGARNGTFSPNDWSKLTSGAKELYTREVFIDETPAIGLSELKAKTRRQKRDFERRGKKLGLVLIDYLQLMRLPKTENLARALGEITSGLKSFAKEISAPVVLLSQLNRKCEERTDKRPMLSDLRESGAIEQDADNVLMIYRDEYYDPDSDDKGIAEVLVAKQRNGPQGVVKLKFVSETTTFKNLATEQEEYRAYADN